MRGVLVIAVFCMAVGVGVLFKFCDGTTGLSFGYPISATIIHVDITTKGMAAVVGLALTGFGSFLLIVATMIAAIGLFRRNQAPLKRRESAFEE